MFTRLIRFFIAVIVAFTALACSPGAGQNANAPNSNTNAARASESPSRVATPSNQFTEADIAKLKWLEGRWKGMDDTKPLFEGIRFEGTTMIIDTFADESMSKVVDTARFELKDGEFGRTSGDQRSAASSITDTAIQFVAAPVQPGSRAKGNNFRFEKTASGFNAVLEVPAGTNRPASENVYKMEPLKPAAK